MFLIWDIVKSLINSVKKLILNNIKFKKGHALHNIIILKFLITLSLEAKYKNIRTNRCSTWLMRSESESFYRQNLKLKVKDINKMNKHKILYN